MRYLAHECHYRYSREHSSGKLVFLAPWIKARRVSVKHSSARVGGGIFARERPSLLFYGLEAATIQGVLDGLDAFCIFVVVVAVPGPLEGTRDRVDWDVVDGLRHDECVDYYQEYGNLVFGSVHFSAKDRSMGAYDTCPKTPRWGTPGLSLRWFCQIPHRYKVDHRQESSNLGKPGSDGDFEVVDHGPGFC